MSPSSLMLVEYHVSGRDAGPLMGVPDKSKMLSWTGHLIPPSLLTSSLLRRCVQIPEKHAMPARVRVRMASGFVSRRADSLGRAIRLGMLAPSAWACEQSSAARGMEAARASQARQSRRDMEGIFKVPGREFKIQNAKFRT